MAYSSPATHGTPVPGGPIPGMLMTATSAIVATQPDAKRLDAMDPPANGMYQGKKIVVAPELAGLPPPTSAPVHASAPAHAPAAPAVLGLEMRPEGAIVPTKEAAKQLDAMDPPLNGMYNGKKIYVRGPTQAVLAPAPAPIYTPPAPIYMPPPPVTTYSYAPLPPVVAPPAAPLPPTYIAGAPGVAAAPTQAAAFALDAADGVIDGKSFGASVVVGAGAPAVDDRRVVSVEYFDCGPVKPSSKYPNTFTTQREAAPIPPAYEPPVQAAPVQEYGGARSMYAAGTPEGSAQAMFQRFDTDHDGLLDLFQFYQAMNQLGAGMSFEDAKAAFSGQEQASIEEPEFIRYFTSNYAVKQ
uniref:EF-hand domain-containing protein n=1 Tax=Eutreptiella gymnastica TaxID=73025 RepID=A0A7S4G571_9EUGL